MEYLDFLRGLHEAVRPRAYLEIGLRHGDSLALADCPALGVDPAYNLRVELGDNVQLLRERHQRGQTVHHGQRTQGRQARDHRHRRGCDRRALGRGSSSRSEGGGGGCS